MNKKLFWIFFLILFLVLGFVYWNSIKQNSAIPLTNNESPTVSSIPTQAHALTETTSLKKGEVLNQKDSLSWQKKKEALLQKMNGTTENPIEADEEISVLAQSLGKEELSELYKTVLNSKSSGDDKLLSTELIIRSPSPDSLSLLKKIIETPATEITKNQSLQLEQRAVQMQAIEGLSQKKEFSSEAEKILNELSGKLDDVQLNHRIQQSLGAIKGLAPSVEEQDKETLKKVLK